MGFLPQELVQVGVIGGTHGVRGEVRVQSTSDFPEERLQKPGRRSDGSSEAVSWVAAGDALLGGFSRRRKDWVQRQQLLV